MDARDIIKKGLLFTGKLFFKAGRIIELPEHPNKLLIFTRKAIGDVVMAIPAFRSLRNQYPDTQITLYTMEWNRGIVEQLPFFNKVVFVDNSVAMNKSVIGILEFIIQMRKQHYDMAVLFDSFTFPLYCALANIPVRVGYEFNDEGFALTHKVKIHETDYRLEQFLEVIKLIGCKTDDKSMYFPVDLQKDDVRHINSLLSDLPDSKYLLGIVPGGGRNPGQILEAKNWTREGYSNLIGKLLENHNVNILLFGKDEDALIAKDILHTLHIQQPHARIERIANLCNKTSILQAAALLKKCHVVLTNDTSLMHLAAAVGTPTISIFGPTDSGSLAPRDPMHQVVKSDLACSPCYENGGYLYCNGECMLGIPWQKIYVKIKEVLDKIPSS